MEQIKLESFNIFGKKRNEGIISIANNQVTFPSGKTYTVLPCREYTFQIHKNTISASGGIDGFLRFLNEINDSESPFNPCYTELFINM